MHKLKDYSQADIHKDINIDSYIELIKLIQSNEYAIIQYDQVEKHNKYIIIRHDVDLDLYYAYEMAKIEAKHNCRSTYFIMLHNPLYNALSKDSISMLKEMLGMGHKIGIHFDVKKKLKGK